MKDVRFAAVVVVYNRFCGDSPTCKALKESGIDGLTVLIYDNSTKDCRNREYCRENGFVYLGGEGNHGISKAYNRAVDYICSQKMADVVCFFDDDTSLTTDYFSLLREAVISSDAMIFLPLISSGKALISPIRITPDHKVTLFCGVKEALCYKGTDISAINSCMAVRMSLFDTFSYDENIFLDGVDHHFMDEAVRRRGVAFKVFPYSCKHSFSGMEKPEFEAALNRFRIFAKDYGYIFRHKKSAYLKLVGKRALKLCIQYRSPAFFRFV